MENATTTTTTTTTTTSTNPLEIKKPLDESSSALSPNGPIKYYESLISLYTNLHPEIIAYQTFLFNLLITTTVLFFTGVFYGLNSGHLVVIAALPPLVALTYGLGFNANGGILRIAFKKLQIELILQRDGLKMFDWESKFGALGIQRKPMIENLFLVILLTAFMSFGFVKTFDRTLIPLLNDDPNMIKYPISLLKLFIWVDSLSVAFLMLCVFKFLTLKNNYKKKITAIKTGYGIE